MMIVKRKVNRVFPLYSSRECKIMAVSLHAAPWDAYAMLRALNGAAREAGCGGFPGQGSQSEEDRPTGQKSGVSE